MMMLEIRQCLLVLLIFISGCSQAGEDSAMGRKEIESLIQRNVPMGSSTSQVLAFLDTNKIEHSDYQNKQGAIYGIVHNTSQSSMVKSSVQIEFHFDEKTNLKDYSVKEVFTGP